MGAPKWPVVTRVEILRGVKLRGSVVIVAGLDTQGRRPAFQFLADVFEEPLGKEFRPKLGTTLLNKVGVAQAEHML